MQKSHLLIIICAVSFMFSCTGLKKFSTKEKKQLNQLINEAPLGEHYIGLAVFDIEKEEWLYRHHADRLFTPASNTKILTFYTGLKFLQDSFPLADTMSRRNQMMIYPNGNPVFLHPEFASLQPDWAKDLRLENIQKINIIDRPTQNKRFGPGWSWADYAYYYQAEVTAFPIYGNMLRVEWDSIRQKEHISPAFLSDYTSVEYNRSKKGIRIQRDEFSNQYKVEIGHEIPHQYVRNAPFRFEPYTATRMLEDTFFRPTQYSYGAIKPDVQAFHPIPMDTVYRKMMLESDNFLAEQILLMASGMLGDTLSSRKMIRHMFEHDFDFWNNQIQWVDGSGLSRYNLFTPEFIIDVLIKVKNEIGYDNIPYYFPTGGKTGTIKYWYGADEPYVFAKTGTLSNHHALSGFIKTRSGKWLAFSFFNDNYIGSSSRIKPGMQKVLEHIRDSY